MHYKVDWKQVKRGVILLPCTFQRCLINSPVNSSGHIELIAAYQEQPTEPCYQAGQIYEHPITRDLTEAYAILSHHNEALTYDELVEVIGQWFTSLIPLCQSTDRPLFIAKWSALNPELLFTLYGWIRVFLKDTVKIITYEP